MKLFILDKDENLIGSLSGNAEKSATHFFNANIVKELNKGRQLTFEVDMREENVADLIKEEYHIIFKDGDAFRLVTIKEIVDIHNTDFIKEVFCEDSSIELYDEVVLTDLDLSITHEAEDVANHLLKETRWTLGECDNVRRMKLSEKMAAKSVLNGLNMLIDTFKMEIDFEVDFVHNEIISRKVIIKENLGRDLGKRIEYSKDMESLKRTVDTSDIKTAVIPFGKLDEETGLYVTIAGITWTEEDNGLDKPAGQLYLEDKKATEQWGYVGENGKRPRWIAIEYPEVESPNELINYANMQLVSHKEPKVTYEVEAVDLYRLLDDEDFSFETVEVGDTVAIIDHEFNPPLTLKSRIVKIEESYSEFNTERKITLGNIVPTLVDKDIKTQISEIGGTVSGVTVDLSAIQNQINDLKDKTGTGIWEKLEPINQMLFDKQLGYHYMSESDGIWVYDRPADQQPTKAIVLKGGQLGIANWDKQTMSWKVGTFIDGKNVNASMINTGTLSADRIKAGSITAEKLEVSVKNKIDNSVTNEDVEAKLKVQADNIKAEVSKTYETKESVIEKINNIEVGGLNYIKDYRFSKSEVWAKFNSSATVDIENHWGKLSGRTENTFLSQILPDEAVKSGVTLTLQYEIKCEDVRAGTGTDSFLIRTQLTGYKNDGGYVADIGIFSRHETEVQTLNENGWTKVVKTLKLSYTHDLDYVRLRLYARNFEGNIYFRNVKLERGTKATDPSPSPEDVAEDIKIIEAEMNNFENTVNTTFKDGILSKAEATAIKQHLTILETTKAEIDKEYETIYNHSLLSQSLKTSLSNSKKAYDNAYKSLKSTIESAIKDETVSDSDQDNVSQAFTTYNNAVGTYKAEIQKSLDFISTAKVNDLKIGAVNRAFKTSEAAEFTFSGTENNAWQPYDISQDISNKDVIIAFDFETTNLAYGSGGILRFQSSYTSTSGSTVWQPSVTLTDLIPAGTNVGTVEFTTKFTNMASNGLFRFRADNVTGKLKISKARVIVGNKDVGWTPAPEDIPTTETLNNQLQGLIDQSNDLMQKYENMVTDKVITPNEKIHLKAELEHMLNKQENLGLLVDAIGNPTLTTHFKELKTLYDSAVSIINPFLVDMTTVEEADETEIYKRISAFHGQYETVLRLVQTVLNSTIVEVKTEVNQVADGVTTAITKSEEALGVTKTIGKHFDFTADGWVRIYASVDGVRGSFMTQITDSRLSFYDGATEVAYISNKDLYISDAKIINTLTVGNMALEKSAKGGMVFRWKG